MTTLTLDPKVAEHMGYERIAAATSVDANGLLIEFALLPPEDPNGMGHFREWTIAIHQDCDPDEPSRGTSGLEFCGPDRGEAERLYLEAIDEVKADIAARNSIGRSL
jgi:hypothetical protein